jgi:hypothetical protein
VDTQAVHDVLGPNSLPPHQQPRTACKGNECISEVQI